MLECSGKRAYNRDFTEFELGDKRSLNIVRVLI